MTTWTQGEFAKMQKIARRHHFMCPLRLAMVTKEDPDGDRVCNCNGKLNSYGESKTTPREKTLADVLRQLDA